MASPKNGPSSLNPEVLGLIENNNTNTMQFPNDLHFSATRGSKSHLKGGILRQHIVLQSAKDGLSLFSAQLQKPLEAKAPLIAQFSEVRPGHSRLIRSNLGEAEMFSDGRNWWR